MPVTGVGVTISGVTRPTGGAENRLIYIGDFSEELPAEAGFFLRREDKAALKRLFCPELSAILIRIKEWLSPFCYSGTVTHVTSGWRIFSWGRS